MKKVLIIFMLVSCIALAQTYTRPDNLSVGGVADWVMISGHIASGTVDPTSAVDEGALYVNVATPTAPVLWRRGASDWYVVAGGGTPGTTDHSALDNLDFASSGHTGFVATQTVIDLDNELTVHIASGTDPHGANMTITESLTIGSGAASFEWIYDGTILTASGATLLLKNIDSYADNDAAITGGLATGTLYRSGDSLNIVW